METSEGRTFGAWLQAEREAAGVSQIDVANRVPLHVVTLSRIENGHQGYKRETVIKIVEAINLLSDGHRVDLDVALRKAGFDAPQKPPSTVPEFLEALERLGFDFGPTLINFDGWTAEDFEEMIERIKRDLDLMARRKR